MNSHSSRIAWLKEHGFLPDVRSVNLEKFGTVLWVDGHKGKRMVSLWLAVRDGTAMVHGLEPPMSWAELQNWIDPQPEPEKEPGPPVKVQKGLF
jgi:hypothetical protein